MIKSCMWYPLLVNYAGEGHLTRAAADSGAEGPAWWASPALLLHAGRPGAWAAACVFQPLLPEG